MVTSGLGGYWWKSFRHVQLLSEPPEAMSVSYTVALCSMRRDTHRRAPATVIDTENEAVSRASFSVCRACRIRGDRDVSAYDEANGLVAFGVSATANRF